MASDLIHSSNDAGRHKGYAGQALTSVHFAGRQGLGLFISRKSFRYVLATVRTLTVQNSRLHSSE